MKAAVDHAHGEVVALAPAAVLENSSQGEHLVDSLLRRTLCRRRLLMSPLL